jgi:hypothetical protein
VDEATIAAIDWSGARGETKRHTGIWITAVRGGEVLQDRGGWSRVEAMGFVAALPPPVVAGFDFSFGVPAWFARELGCTTIEAVWARAARDGEHWLAPTPPFWNTKCPHERAARFRGCEARLRETGHQPKSVFQLVGNGQVGAGSVRGMPYLMQLRDAGFAIWPIDGAGERTAIEIYPSLLRKRLPVLDNDEAPSPHARDARASARVMQTRAAELRELAAATDPVTRIEGGVWIPAGARAATEGERSA